MALKPIKFHGLIKRKSLSALRVFYVGFVKRVLDYEPINFQMGLFGTLHVMIFGYLDFLRHVSAACLKFDRVAIVNHSVSSGKNEQNLSLDLLYRLLNLDIEWIEL